jgi:hypothetical protein
MASIMSNTIQDIWGQSIDKIEYLNLHLRHHFKNYSGEETEEQILKKFLANFESNGSIDGMVMNDSTVLLCGILCQLT